MCSPTVKLTSDIFDYLDQNGERKPITKFIWINSNNVEVEVINYGATITRILVPDRDNVAVDIVMGYANIRGYLSPLNPYFGATVGRVANRIKNAEFEIDGQKCQVTKNCGEHMLHGGNKGFSMVLWDYLIKDTKLILTYMSPDGEEGFPGSVLTTQTMELTIDNEFKMDIISVTSKKTPVSLTNHTYFNLAGHDSGFKGLQNHLIQIPASKTTETDNSVATGKLLDVAPSNDFRTPVEFATAFEKQSDGFDLNYCLDNECLNSNGVRLSGRAEHPPSGRVLEVWSNQPGVQLYTSNFFPESGESDPEKQIKGKDGKFYEKFGAFCFEPQNYPNAVNLANFPNAILSPGEQYQIKMIFKFGVN